MRTIELTKEFRPGVVGWICDELQRTAEFVGKTVRAFLWTCAVTVFFVGLATITGIAYTYFNSYLELSIYHMEKGEFKQLKF